MKTYIRIEATLPVDSRSHCETTTGRDYELFLIEKFIVPVGLTFMRRSQALAVWGDATRAKPSDVGSAMASLGLFASRHGPCGLPAVFAARSRPTPRRRSSAKRVRPRFHCFQAMARYRRLTIHKARACTFVPRVAENDYFLCSGNKSSRVRRGGKICRE